MHEPAHFAKWKLVRAIRLALLPCAVLGGAAQAQVVSLGTLDGVSGFRLDGSAVNERSGISVAAAGDVNGDGIGDLIIGAAGAGPNGINSGSSFVAFGRSTGFVAALNLSGLNGTTGFRLNGGAAGDASGTSVAAAGDVNGDGMDDLLIGAPGADPNGTIDAGSSYLVFGRSTGFAPVLALSSLDGATGFRLDGVAAGNASGAPVAAAGDVNGDGIDDFLVGAFRAASNGNDSAGSTYVVFGRSSGFAAVMNLSSLDGTSGFRLDGALAADISGISAAAVGDINGDGTDDLLIGAAGADPNGSASAGSSHVVFGRSTGFAAVLNLGTLNGTTGFRLDGAASGDLSGSFVAAAGDVNHDGIADLLIGAPSADPNGIGVAGISYVMFGRSMGFAASMNLSSINGTTGFRLNGVATYDRSGTAAAGVGDVNGDGIDDVLIGAFGADASGSYSGSSYLVFGRSTGFAAALELGSLNGTTGIRFDGPAAGDNSGISVAGAGDLNGDGIADLVIGATLADHNVPNSGSSYVVFGGPLIGNPVFKDGFE